MNGGRLETVRTVKRGLAVPKTQPSALNHSNQLFNGSFRLSHLTFSLSKPLRFRPLKSRTRGQIECGLHLTRRPHHLLNVNIVNRRTRIDET